MSKQTKKNKSQEEEIYVSSSSEDEEQEASKTGGTDKKLDFAQSLVDYLHKPDANTGKKGSSPRPGPSGSARPKPKAASSKSVHFGTSTSSGGGGGGGGSSGRGAKPIPEKPKPSSAVEEEDGSQTDEDEQDDEKEKNHVSESETSSEEEEKLKREQPFEFPEKPTVYNSKNKLFLKFLRDGERVSKPVPATQDFCGYVFMESAKLSYVVDIRRGFEKATVALVLTSSEANRVTAAEAEKPDKLEPIQAYGCSSEVVSLVKVKLPKRVFFVRDDRVIAEQVAPKAQPIKGKGKGKAPRPSVLYLSLFILGGTEYMPHDSPATSFHKV